MSTNMRTYFRLLAEDRQKGFLACLLRPFLAVASWIYGLAVGTLAFLYSKKILPRKRLPFSVISVGNLAWGGTGKTPLVEYLARKVSERHRTPLILTRGYSHDEVEQMKHHLRGALIGVGKNRWQVAQSMIKNHRINVAILDDGLQHWGIERDIEIVVVNALNPFGNEKLIPRGVLREPLSALKRSAIIVLSHVNLVKADEMAKLRKRLQTLAPKAFLVESYLEPLFFYRANRKVRVPVERMHNKRVSTFSGVGTPRSFQLLLASHLIKPVRNFEFEDHHVYLENELKEIKRVSDSASVDEIVTTEKDFYRSSNLIASTLNPLILATRLRISAGEEVLTDRLFRLLGVTR